MNLVRKIKISKLTNQPLEDIEKEIVDFVNSKVIDLIPFQMDNNQKSIYYMSSEGKYILEQDNNRDILWVRYEDFWETLEEKYLLKNIETQRLIQYIAEQTFKRRLSPIKGAVASHKRVEEAFIHNFYRVEDAFKQVLSKPIPIGEDNFSEVEEAFKNIK